MAAFTMQDRIAQRSEEKARQQAYKVFRYRQTIKCDTNGEVANAQFFSMAPKQRI